MPDEDNIEHLFPTTTFEWRQVKIRRRLQGSSTARAKRARWFGISLWPRDTRLTITVKYRGGAESWWHIEARGRSGAFPGWMPIEDMMQEIHGRR